MRYCVNSAQLAPASEMSGIGLVSSKSPSYSNSAFVPVFRSGSYSEIGPKPYMEDEHIYIDNILEHLDATANFPSTGAFYGVFDGHGGTDADSFVRENILRFIVEDSHFPFCAKKAKSAFLKADLTFVDTGTLDSSSGTTALAALISGLWDVMSSQCGVTIARKEVMLHNDPERCSRELGREALKRNTRDNLTVVVVCFSPNPPPLLEIPKLKFKRSISAEGLNLLQEVLDSKS